MTRYGLMLSSALVSGVTGFAAQAQVASETYKYDAHGRLLSSKTSGGVNANEARSQCYDRVGNRQSALSDSAGSLATCTPTPALPTPSPTPTPTPTPTPSVITLTDGTMTVLPQYGETYDCFILSMPEWNLYSRFCKLRTTDYPVFTDNQGTRSFATGYSMTQNYILKVQSSYFGTAN